MSPLHAFRVSVLAAAFLAAGCSLTPELRRPAAPVAGVFPPSADAIATTEGRAATDIGWREFFRDARLQALIERALANNRDLRLAALRIEEARATYRIQAADLLPTVAATASGSRSKIFTPLIPGGAAIPLTQYQVGLGVTAFELDFFDRLGSLRDAALAQYLATAEAARSARISLVAQVARSYLAERAFAEQLALAQRTLASREAALDITRQRVDAGASSALDLRQAESLVQQARVSVASFARQQAQAANALSLLVGAPLDTASLPAPLVLAEQLPVVDIRAGVPSEVLIDRPDIRSAEQQLVAANANIGAARAAFFPRISLTTTLGRASTELGGLVGSGGFTLWSFAPQLTLPIFDAGRNRANLDLAEVRRDVGIANYERAIQVAFREVADALVARGELERELEAQRRLREAERARLSLTEQRREAGIIDALTFLDAERQTFAAEQAVLQSQLLRNTNAVDLYVALGGGLNADGVAAAAEAGGTTGIAPSADAVARPAR